MSVKARTFGSAESRRLWEVYSSIDWSGGAGLLALVIRFGVERFERALGQARADWLELGKDESWSPDEVAELSYFVGDEPFQTCRDRLA